MRSQRERHKFHDVQPAPPWMSGSGRGTGSCWGGERGDDDRLRWEGDTEKYGSGTERRKGRREEQTCSDRWEDEVGEEEKAESRLQVILLGSDVLQQII